MNILLQRYLPLMEFLEGQSGYGTYIVKMHGKRPVKVWQLSTAQTFESKTTLENFSITQDTSF
jgi:hypothetical protein